MYDVKGYPKSEAGVRTIVVPDGYVWILNRIQNLNPFSEFVFINKGKRVNAQSIRKRLTYVCQKLNIYPKSPHKIRKTYGTILLDNNIDSKLVTGQMGHTNLLCTERHYHRNRRSLEQKGKIISAIPEFAWDKSAQ